MDDSHLDELIDVVARQMTAGEPREGFRARVVAQIESGSGNRDSGFGAWRPALAGLAAAAAIVAAVVIWRNGAPVNDERRASPVTASKAATPTPGMTSATPAPETTSTLRLPPPPGVRRTGTADTAYRSSSAIDALAPPALSTPALDVESIGLGTLPSADSIQLDKLEPITPVAVAPLGEGDRP